MPVPQDQSLQPVSAPATLAQRTTSNRANTAPAILDALSDLFPVKPQADNFGHLSTGAEKLSSDVGNDWMIVVRKMKTLGVSRFTIEGETGGRIIFACLVPIAGRHAITQRFEAEGSDLIEVAQATLRRIALWRAAQITVHPGTTRSE